MEKNFDRLLEEKLGRLKVEYDPESWSLLEQRLDTSLAGTPEVNDKVLDEVIHERLHRLRKPYQESHWRLMSARLDREVSLVRQILRYKVLEMGMVALLLLTIIQYLPMHPPAGSHWPPDIEKAFPAEYRKFENKRRENANSPLPVSPSTERPVADASKASPTSTPGQPGNKKEENLQGSERRSLAVNSASWDTARKKFQLDRLENAVDLTEKLHRINEVYVPSPLVSEKKITLPKNSFGIAEEDFVTAALDPLEPGPLSYSDRVEQAILEYQPPKRKTFFRVGMFGSGDYNRVITPADEKLGLERLARYSAGYGGGLTFGFEFGRWETETGLIYAAKQYQARPIVFFQGSFKDGYLGKGVKDIEINVVNVPLNFRYNFLRREKWRMYMLGGASIQIAVQANYYTSNQDGFRSSSFAPAPAPSSFGQGNYGSFRTLADNLPGGWFEGGTFEENGYLTGNVGLGLERYFAGQWSVFVQPTYQHSINYFLRGLGPTKDEINTLSLYTGIRLRLQK